MQGLSFTNNTKRTLVLIVEPIAEEYELHHGDKIEIGHPLYLDHREMIDIQIDDDTVVIFVPEEAKITRNGKVVTPRSGED